MIIGSAATAIAAVTAGLMSYYTWGYAFSRPQLLPDILRDQSRICVENLWTFKFSQDNGALTALNEGQPSPRPEEFARLADQIGSTREDDFLNLLRRFNCWPKRFRSAADANSLLQGKLGEELCSKSSDVSGGESGRYWAHGWAAVLRLDDGTRLLYANSSRRLSKPETFTFVESVGSLGDGRILGSVGYLYERGGDGGWMHFGPNFLMLLVPAALITAFLVRINKESDKESAGCNKPMGTASADGAGRGASPRDEQTEPAPAQPARPADG
jgi:hypothetical protein